VTLSGIVMLTDGGHGIITTHELSDVGVIWWYYRPLPSVQYFYRLVTGASCRKLVYTITLHLKRRYISIMYVLVALVFTFPLQ